MTTILLIGGCGSGKTWTMLELIRENGEFIKKKCDLIKFMLNEQKNIAILGTYDGSMFQGSDRLSMAVMKSAQKMRNYQQDKKITIIAEGDRFTNSNFISIFDPIIVKISDSGEAGRIKRGSKQSERHIKSIQTRVDNIKHNYEVKNSAEAFKLIKKLIDDKN